MPESEPPSSPPDPAPDGGPAAAADRGDFRGAAEAAGTPGIATLRRDKRWWLALSLAAAALLLSAYLTHASLTGTDQLPGCGGSATGGGGGCADVLNSKWSKVVGIPVSIPACLLYVLVLAALPAPNRFPRATALNTFAFTILGSALWFVSLMIFQVGTPCYYCLAAHGVGVSLAVTLLVITFQEDIHPRPKTRVWAVPAVLATLAVGGLIYAQINIRAQVAVPVAGMTRVTTEGRTATLLGGRLTLDLTDAPSVGAHDAPHTLLKFFDYQCPHCRAAHEAMQQLPGAGAGVRTVLLPTPLDPTINPFISEFPRPQFRHSVAIAKLALAIHAIDPRKLEQFDTWAYGDGWPHTAEQARAFADTLVDPLLLSLKLDDPALDASLQRNITAWGRSRDAGLVGGLPVLLNPDTGKLVYGHLDSPDAIVTLLQPDPTPQTLP